MDDQPTRDPLDDTQPTAERPRRGSARARQERRRQRRIAAGEPLPSLTPPPSGPPTESPAESPAEPTAAFPERARPLSDSAAYTPPAWPPTAAPDSADAAPPALPRRRRRADRPARAGIGIPRIQLPQINLTIDRVGLYLIGSVIFVVVVVIVLGRVRNQPVAALPNAIWIGTEWTYENRTDEEVETFVARLQAHQIGTVYAWVSWLQENGEWRGTPENYAAVAAFVEQFNRLYPEADLYGWVSFPADLGGYRMDDANLQQQIADFSARVVDEFGFEGVFLNIEPVRNDDPNFLDLVRGVRRALDVDVPISVAIPPDWSPVGATIPVPPLIVPGTEWSRDYKQSVALLVDELAVMAYNSGLRAANDYSAWVAYQVETYAEAVASLSGVNTEVIIGIPTYDAEPPGHDPLVENVPSAIAGIQTGLAAAGENASAVTGVAIYAGWETDETEWADFARMWVNAR
ncbi:MAG: hypothetical protein GYB67_10035 [Chloroflexi bacterium]|nr:hypothetical protein [Chloroflexota bacterium]